MYIYLYICFIYEYLISTICTTAPSQISESTFLVKINEFDLMHISHDSYGILFLVVSYDYIHKYHKPFSTVHFYGYAQNREYLKHFLFTIFGIDHNGLIFWLNISVRETNLLYFNVFYIFSTIIKCKQL